LSSLAQPPPRPCSAQAREPAKLALFPAEGDCLSHIRVGSPALRQERRRETAPCARPAISSFHCGQTRRACPDRNPRNRQARVWPAQALQAIRFENLHACVQLFPSAVINADRTSARARTPIGLSASPVIMSIYLRAAATSWLFQADKASSSR